MGPCLSYKQTESFDINDQVRYLSEELDKLETEKNTLISKHQNMYNKIDKG
jgi:hypothetical protein